MTRGTTPTVTLVVNGTDLADYSEIEIAFKQGSTLVVKKLSEEELSIEGNTIKTKLTQEETLAFAPHPVKIQMKAMTSDGTVVPSDIVVRSVKDILDESVMDNGSRT